MAFYDKVFAVAYDPFLALGERAGMRAIRRGVLVGATGRVLEIGAGSGLNLGLYPPRVASLTFTEPDPAMSRRFARRASRLSQSHQAVQAPAERLPFADDSFDTVASTLVLCTVPDLPAVLREIDRVLAPGGRLLLVEHVRADQAQLARWQDRLHAPWRAIAAGCHCNRDTVAELRSAGFSVRDLESARWRRMPLIVAPLIAGPVRRIADENPT